MKLTCLRVETWILGMSWHVLVHLETSNTSMSCDVKLDAMCRRQAGLNLIQVRKLQLQIRQWLEDRNHVCSLQEQ